LINAQLTDVRLEEKDVRALHDRVEYLRRSQRILEPSHDLATSFEPVDFESAGDVKRLRPILASVLADLLR